MNTPQYKIHGLVRRNKKKELSKLKLLKKSFWWHHQLDMDMAKMYGSSGDYPMSKAKAEVKYKKLCLNIENLEQLLSIPY